MTPVPRERASATATGTVAARIGSTCVNMSKLLGRHARIRRRQFRTRRRRKQLALTRPAPAGSRDRLTMANGKIVDGEARERLIIWIRRRMDEFGITPQAIAESIEQDLANRPVYRDARGNEWNGQGVMPDWLLAAKHAGVSPDFFRIESVPEESAASRKADPRQLNLFR